MKQQTPPSLSTDELFNYLRFAIDANGTSTVQQMDIVEILETSFHTDKDRNLILVLEIKTSVPSWHTLYARIYDGFVTDNQLNIWEDFPRTPAHLEHSSSIMAAELESCARMLEISMGCQANQSLKITKYRYLVQEIIPEAFGKIPGMCPTRLHKIFNETCKLLEENEGLLPEDILELAEGIVDVKEGQ